MAWCGMMAQFKDVGLGWGQAWVALLGRGGGMERKRERERDGGMEGQRSQALLISFLLCFLAFFSSPPIYKSINVRSYVLCHCSVFKSLKRDVVCVTGRVGGARPCPKART